MNTTKPAKASLQEAHAPPADALQASIDNAHDNYMRGNIDATTRDYLIDKAKLAASAQVRAVEPVPVAQGIELRLRDTAQMRTQFPKWLCDEMEKAADTIADYARHDEIVDAYVHFKLRAEVAEASLAACRAGAVVEWNSAIEAAAKYAADTMYMLDGSTFSIDDEVRKLKK